jgi:acyl carrier protein
VTALEQAVAGEILRVAREAVAFEGEPPGLEEPLAGRLDSLRLLTLVVAVEDRFHVTLTDDDAMAARTLADLARLVVARAPDERLPAGARPDPAPVAVT